jgi:2-polyprenyl-6-methoxyphenol hydroxylase-like FAD-dependent oxidoreductase
LLQPELGQLAYTIAKPLGSLRTYPVAMQRATQLATEHGVLLGAAATHILPITAQGLNLAIRDMDMLNNMLLHTGKVVWSKEQAQAYNQRRLPDHRAHYQQIQRLLQLFHARGGLAAAIRSIGLGAAGSWRGMSRLLTLHGAGMQVSPFDIGW